MQLAFNPALSNSAFADQAKIYNIRGASAAASGADFGTTLADVSVQQGIDVRAVSSASGTAASGAQQGAQTPLSLTRSSGTAQPLGREVLYYDPQTGGYSQTAPAGSGGGSSGMAAGTSTGKATGNATGARADNDVKISLNPRLDPSASEVSAEDDDFGLGDLIDILNPLQHIPVIGTIYRDMTGDTIKPAARVMGDVMYGALVGGVVLATVASFGSLAVEQQMGDEPTNLVAQALFGDSDDSVQFADAGAAQTTTSYQTASVTTPQAQRAAQVDMAAAQTDALGPSVASASSATTAVQQSAAKQPYGGVMMPPAQMAQMVASHQAGREHGATLSAAPRMATNKAMAEIRSKTSAQEQVKMAAQTMDLPLAGTEAKDNNKTLGQMMRDQADVKAKGGALPAQLVQDMMLMALDKYKTAGGGAISEMKTQSSGLN